MDPELLELKLKTSLTALADFLLPRVCVVCGRQLLPAERHICAECLSDLPLTRFETMSRNPMADKLNAALPDESSYCFATALFYYIPDCGYDHITKSLKYGRNLKCGRHFSSMLAERIRLSPLYSDVDAVVAVPLHRLRRWKRGYNQAEVIALEMAGVLGCVFLPKALRRVRRTDSQTHKSAEDRNRNVEGAFRAGELPQNLRHILLVDDVFTTGATLSACLKELRRTAGTQTRISVATLAFVE